MHRTRCWARPDRQNRIVKFSKERVDDNEDEHIRDILSESRVLRVGIIHLPASYPARFEQVFEILVVWVRSFETVSHGE